MEKQAKKLMKGAKSNWNKAKRSYICRSLKDLIRAYRACTTRSEERALVKKEAAHIRDLFREGDKHFRRQNIAKLLFFHMNGYPTDFGITECIKLCASPRFADKRVAYLGMTILVDETEQVLMLMTNSMKQDLNSSDANIVSLALNVLSDVASAEMLRELMPEIENHMRSPNPLIRKKAGLAAVRAVRKLSSEETFNILDFTATYFDTRSSAVHVSGAALVAALCSQVESNALNLHTSVFPTLVSILSEQASGSAPQRAADLYGSTHEPANPFLVAKLLAALRILFSYSLPSETASDDIGALLISLADKFDGSKISNCAILYEIVRISLYLPSHTALKTLVTQIMGRFLAHKEATVRYIALKELNALADVDGAICLDAVPELSERLLSGLREMDPTVRRQAVELIFRTTNASNVKKMVAEIGEYIITSTNAQAGRDGCEKLFLIADEYGPSDEWKVDTFVKALTLGHRFVSDELISCFVAFVSAHPAIRSHAVHTLFESVLRPHTTQRKQHVDLLGGIQPMPKLESKVTNNEKVQRKPRIESMALYVVGEYASLGDSVDTCAILNVCDALTTSDDHPIIRDVENGQEEDFAAVAEAAITVLLKVAARAGEGRIPTVDDVTDMLSELDVLQSLAVPLTSTPQADADDFALKLLTDSNVESQTSAPDIDVMALSALGTGNGSNSANAGALVVHTAEEMNTDSTNNEADVVQRVRVILKRLTNSRNIEQQQRACEYIALLDTSSANMLAHVVSPTPTMKYSGVRAAVEHKQPRGASHNAGAVTDGSELLLDLMDNEQSTTGPAAITTGEDTLDDGLETLDALAFGGSAAAEAGKVEDLLALTMSNKPGTSDSPPQPSAVSPGKLAIDALTADELSGIGTKESVAVSTRERLTSPVLESEHVRIDVTFDTPEMWGEETHSTGIMTIVNTSTQRLSECVLQLAVPRYMRLEMDPASSSEAAPGQSIRQSVRFINSAQNAKPMQLRYRLEFRLQNDVHLTRLEGVANNITKLYMIQ